MSCALCGADMTLQESRHSPVAYFHCAGCGRWVASNYGEEALRSHTARLASAGRRSLGGAEDVEFDRIKSRLTAFLAAIDASDPYQALGVAASATDEAIRARFHELALAHHPDRGGDVAEMQRYAQAYERICQGRERLGRVSREPPPQPTVRCEPRRPQAVVARPPGPGRR